MAMAPDLQEYYEDQLDMMGSRGWVAMCEDFENILKVLKDVTTATPETLLNRQGRIAEIVFILNRRDTLSAAYEELRNAT